MQTTFRLGHKICFKTSVLYPTQIPPAYFFAVLTNVFFTITSTLFKYLAVDTIFQEPLKGQQKFYLRISQKETIDGDQNGIQKPNVNYVESENEEVGVEAQD